MNGIASATAWALVHFLWQGTLIGLATGGVLSLLERRKASTRYALAAGALLVMAALPVLTAMQLAQLQAETFPEAPAAAVPGSAGILPAPGSAGILPAASAPQTFGGSLLPWILGLWLAGVAALSVYHLGGWRFARRLSARGQPAGEAAAALARGLCRRLGIRRAVTFLESSAISVPMVVGWLRPVVLVPASALAGLSPAQLEAILAHELAHVRRHDYLVNLLQTAVETLLFYHPAVWWVSAQIRRERENCCDDLAVAACGDRLGYARALVDLEVLRGTPRLALAASGGSLTDRVRRLVGAAPGRPSRRFFAAGLLALVLLPAGAAVQLACARGSAKGSSSAAAAKTPDATRYGRWEATSSATGVRLEMTYRKAGWGSWTSIDEYPLRELPGFRAGSDVRYELRRDAGVFRLRGSFDGRRGRGTVTFTANPVYAKIMGLPASSDRLMELAIHDISLVFVREMRELGVGAPAPAQQRGHDSPFAFLRDFTEFRRRDSFADQLFQLRIHNITPDYLRGMRDAGFRHLQTWQLVELSIHGVQPEYVEGLRATGYRRLFPYRIVEFHNHGITPEWLRGIVETGYAAATPDQILSLHIHAIDGDFIRKAQAQGYRGLRPEQLIELSVQGKVRA